MIVQCKEEDVEKNGYTLTDTLTHMQHNDQAQYTVLGWVKIESDIFRRTILTLLQTSSNLKYFFKWIFNN